MPPYTNVVSYPERIGARAAVRSAMEVEGQPPQYGSPRKLGTCRRFEVPHSAELLGRYGSDAGLLMRAWGSGPPKHRERPPASRSNPHADHFDPAPAYDHAVDGRRREPSVDQLDQQLGLEPVGQHDRLGAAVDGCLKQFERSTALLLRRRHVGGLPNLPVAPAVSQC